MAEAERFDLVVIGGGPAGYVAAIRAAQLGMKVACVEKRPTLGGTCLNVGCIPSKALLDSSEHYLMAREGLARHGVVVGDVRLDLATMMARKDKVVGDLTSGIASLFRKNKVTPVAGTARLVGPDAVAVTAEGGSGGAGERTLRAGRILLATGSEPAALPGVPFDGDRIVSSTEALALPEVPRHLIVIGAGVIGLELGSVWRRLGAEVSVVELLPALLGTLDGQVQRLAQRVLARQGLQFHLAMRVTGVERTAGAVRVTARPVTPEGAPGEPIAIEGDRLLVAVGRRPYTAGLGLAEVGVALDRHGRIPVDGDYRTGVPSIYAVGDVIAGPMLAHKAMDEGVAAVETMAGRHGHVNYAAIPWIVYTWPEIAWVGVGEEELKAQGRAYRVGSYPFQATPRAKCMGETDGLVKIIADAGTDRLLGVLVIGPRASDVIAEAALAFEFGASAEDLARSVHAHPTLSEAVKEAALGVDKRAIHL
ncbi:MAG: dihydrolipoyl dehydrogenase [Candidatus Lambdaproteobacteria bacterium]|nr:dihydrolipoyl dehydrogenase [Candidatus Lambdaproteobacteria bacterium]